MNLTAIPSLKPIDLLLDMDELLGLTSEQAKDLSITMDACLECGIEKWAENILITFITQRLAIYILSIYPLPLPKKLAEEILRLEPIIAKFYNSELTKEEAICLRADYLKLLSEVSLYVQFLYQPCWGLA